MKLHDLKFFQEYDLSVFQDLALKLVMHSTENEQASKNVSSSITWERLFSAEEVAPRIFNLTFLIPQAFVSFTVLVDAKGNLELSNYSLEYTRCRHCSRLVECRTLLGKRANSRACADKMEVVRLA